MIVLIDNYDSFVFNLARYFERLGQRTRVVRNDATTPGEIESWAPQAIVLSPGPCTPNEAGCSLDVVRKLGCQIPVLGICLGHQAIGAAYGGQIVRAVEPMHGRTSQVFHEGQSVFAGIPTPFAACRYHSLVVDRTSLPDSLQVTAWTADGAIMAIAHRTHPVVGLQFHPESILTDPGFDLLSGFLKSAGITTSGNLPTMESERVSPSLDSPLPTSPVTF